MTLAQFAALVGVSVNTARKWASEGKIDALWTGGSWEVGRDELERYRSEGHLVPFKDRPTHPYPEEDSQ